MLYKLNQAHTLKISVITLIGIFIGTSCFGQFKLSGKINSYNGKDNLSINIPLVFGFYKQHSINIPVHNDGSFEVMLPVKQAKFANLIYKRKFFTLLLNPEKTLKLELNASDTTIKLISGSALAESRVMLKVDLEEYPSFLAENDNNTLLGKLSFTQLNNQIVKPYFARRDEKIKQVWASSINTKDKRLIAAELKYVAYNYLNDLARGAINNKVNTDSLIIAVFDRSSSTPEVFPAGPQYYRFIDNYIRYLETKAFIQVKQEHITPDQAIPYFGISLDSANILVKKYGKPFWRWVGSNRNFKPEVIEQYTYQQITTLFYDKDLRPAEALANAFLARFPASVYADDLRAKITSLRALLAKNSQNENIKIVPDFEKINSIYEVLKPLRGKVVYLDVWGTWCGPCKAELPYVPALKARFANKDVAFVYLDMDDDDMDNSWREFIKVNNLSGLHLRKSRKNIDPFWKELLANAGDKAEYYPQYFIFDKDGKLIVSKAHRPSSEALLYEQIEKVLK